MGRLSAQILTSEKAKKEQIAMKTNKTQSKLDLKQSVAGSSIASSVLENFFSSKGNKTSQKSAQ